jgi:hypothetical protein
VVGNSDVSLNKRILAPFSIFLGLGPIRLKQFIAQKGPDVLIVDINELTEVTIA